MKNKFKIGDYVVFVYLNEIDMNVSREDFFISIVKEIHNIYEEPWITLENGVFIQEDHYRLATENEINREKIKSIFMKSETYGGKYD